MSERERLKQWVNPDLMLMDGTGDVLVHEVKLRDKHGNSTNGFLYGRQFAGRHSLSKLPAREHSSLNFYRILAVCEVDVCRVLQLIGIQDGIESPVLPVGEGAAGVLTVHFDQLFLTTNDYALWIILYCDGVVYCEYKGIRPFFVSRKDNAIDRGGYFIHPG